MRLARPRNDGAMLAGSWVVWSNPYNLSWWASAMLMKIGLLGAAGLIASLAALFWLRPDTNGGQALLMIVVFAIVTGVGRLIWPTGS